MNHRNVPSSSAVGSAGAAVLTLILMLLVGLSVPAAGATPGVSRGPVPLSHIDPALPGQLTIHFIPANPFNDRPGPPHVGVEVHLRRVADIDLNTSEGWGRAESLTLAELLDLPDSAFDDHRSGVSDSSGNVVFSGLPLGLYVITSPATPEAFDSFAGALPRTSGDGRSWVYELTVHPKRHGGPTTEPEDPVSTTVWETTWPAQVTSSAAATVTDAATSTAPEAPTVSVTTTDVVPVAPPAADHGAGARDDNSAQRIGQRLASTGATVLGIVALGLVLVALGIAAVYRERKRWKSE